MKICKYCDSPIPSGYDVCPNCGREVGSEREPQVNRTPYTRNQRQKRPASIIARVVAIVAAVIAILAASLVVYVVYFNHYDHALPYRTVESVSEVAKAVSQEEYEFVNGQLELIKEEFGQPYEHIYESYTIKDDHVSHFYISLSRGVSQFYTYEMVKSFNNLNVVTTERRIYETFKEEEINSKIDTFIDKYVTELGLESGSTIRNELLEMIKSAKKDERIDKLFTSYGHEIKASVNLYSYGYYVTLEEKTLENID